MALGDPSDPRGSSYVQAKPRHRVIDVCPFCSARLLPWVLHVVLGCSRTWGPRRTVMAPPRDVCHQALVPLEPSPIPSVTVRASRGLLAAAHQVLQGIGKGTEGAWAAVAPGDSGGSAHWSSGLCCGQGRPPSPAPRSPGSADIPPPSHRSPAPRSGTACDVSACPLPPGQCLGGGGRAPSAWWEMERGRTLSAEGREVPSHRR